ncbi:MAG: hypothetical protein KAS30_00095 [Candidatus Diapherotrites archaeon]|nr:hypothetical protein [Candidatus Diapherotrites archaeon]
MTKEQFILIEDLSKKFAQYAIENNFGAGLSNISSGSVFIEIYLCDNNENYEAASINYNDEIQINLFSNDFQCSNDFFLEERFENVYKSALNFFNILID